MQVLKRVLLAGFVSALLLAQTPARAVSVAVGDNSGGGSLITITGTSAGAVVVGRSTDIQTFEVDGVSGLTIPTSFSVTITDGPMVGGLRTITATGQSVVGTTPGSEAIVDFTATGFAAGAFIDLSGTITSVSEDAYPGYSYASMLGGSISLSVNKTNTNYTTVLGHNGTVIHSSGFGFQESTVAVPEPASMALLGIGLTGLLAYRRLVRRNSVAS